MSNRLPRDNDRSLHDEREIIARFLASSPREVNPNGWVERRKVYYLSGKLYHITDNFPLWTSSTIAKMLRLMGFKVFEMDVQVTPIISIVMSEIENGE